MRISDWSSDVCSSDLESADLRRAGVGGSQYLAHLLGRAAEHHSLVGRDQRAPDQDRIGRHRGEDRVVVGVRQRLCAGLGGTQDRKSVVSGKRGTVRVDLGWRRIINKKK